MKITLFGANGNIGRRIAAELKARGHDVSTPKRDVLNADSVAEAAKGADALLSAYGPGLTGDVTTVPRATQALVAGAKKAGVKRLLVVGGAGSLTLPDGSELVQSPKFPPAWKPIALAHRDSIPTLRASGLDWTFFAPPALIEPGERTGRFRTGADTLIADAQGQSRISTEDYAVAFADEVEKPRFIGRVATAAY